MTSDTKMINIGEKKLEKERTEWVADSGFWLALLAGPLIFIVFLIIVYMNTPPRAFLLLCIIIWSPAFIFPLLTPKKIVINTGILSISLIGRTIALKKSDIEKIIAFKLRGVHGQLYYFRIVSKRPLSVRFWREMLPLFIHYDLKPYYNLEPARIYDMVEEIKEWIGKEGQSIK